MPAGFCNIAPRKKLGLLDTYDQWAASDVSMFRTLSNWVLPALTLAHFHHVTCLSPIADSCSDKSVDPIFNETTNQLNGAIEEVGKNLARLDYCIVSKIWDYISPEWIKSQVKEGTTDDENRILSDLATQILPSLNNKTACLACIEFDWSVITFSFKNHPDREKDFNEKANIFAPRNEKASGGQFTVRVQFTENGSFRYFHFMYLKKNSTDFGKKILQDNSFAENVLKNDEKQNWDYMEKLAGSAEFRINAANINYTDLLMKYGQGPVVVRPEVELTRPDDQWVFTDSQIRTSPGLVSTNPDKFGYSGCADWADATNGDGAAGKNLPVAEGEWKSFTNNPYLRFRSVREYDYNCGVTGCSRGKKGWNGCYKFWF